MFQPRKLRTRNKNCNRMIGGFYVNDPVNCACGVIARSAPGLAVQQILGLLPKWRIGSGGSGRTCAASSRAALKGSGAPARLFGKLAPRTLMVVGLSLQRLQNAAYQSHTALPAGNPQQFFARSSLRNFPLPRSKPTDLSIYFTRPVQQVSYSITGAS